MAVFEALIAAFILLLFALLFVNGVETLGKQLKLTEFATGAILAAFLTAVPEALLAVLAPAVGTAEAQEVGMGAVVSAPSITLFLGAPLVLLLSRAQPLGALELIRKNYLYFAIILPVPMALGVINSTAGFGAMKKIFGIMLLALFVYLARRISKEEGKAMEAEEELYLARLLSKEVSLSISLFQTLVGVSGMILVAQILIQALSKTANPFVYTLIISPFATCLEETIAAMVWSAKGRGYLGLSVLSGENVIQATAVFGIGMIFTSWNLPAVVMPMVFLMIFASLVYYSQLPRTTLPTLLGLFSYLLYLSYLFLRI